MPNRRFPITLTVGLQYKTYRILTIQQPSSTKAPCRYVVTVQKDDGDTLVIAEAGEVSDEQLCVVKRTGLPDRILPVPSDLQPLFRPGHAITFRKPYGGNALEPA